MAIFEDITVKWGEEDFTIKGDDEIMKLIALIENEATIAELTDGQPKLARAAKAYFVLLKFAGAEELTLAEVYASLLHGGADALRGALESLITIMVPPAAIEVAESKPKKKQKGS